MIATTPIQFAIETSVGWRPIRRQGVPLAWQRIYLDMFSRFFDTPNVHKDYLMVRDGEGGWCAVFYDDKGRVQTEMQP